MAVKLDLKDKLILHQLDINCRKSNAEIGKKAGLSKNVVQYRIKELERKGIIQKYFILIDIEKLGYNYTRYFFNFNNLTNEQHKALIEDFKKMPKISWIGIGEGEWEFEAFFLTRSIQEINEIYQNIIEKYSKYILDKLVNPTTCEYVFLQRYAYLENDEQCKIARTTDKIEKIDEKDMKILTELQKNPKITVLELSRIVSLTPKIVSLRIKGLVKKNIILGFRYQLNHKLLGYDYNRVFFLLQNITKEKRRNFINYLKTLKSLFYMVESLGRYDTECEFIVKSQNELYSILSEIRNKFPDLIRNYKTNLIYEIYITH